MTQIRGGLFYVDRYMIFDGTGKPGDMRLRAFESIPANALLEIKATDKELQIRHSGKKIGTTDQNPGFSNAKRCLDEGWHVIAIKKEASKGKERWHSVDIGLDGRTDRYGSEMHYKGYVSILGISPTATDVERTYFDVFLKARSRGIDCPQLTQNAFSKFAIDFERRQYDVKEGGDESSDTIDDTARKADDMMSIAIDVETTGLDPKNDEVLSLSIVDNNHMVLFDELIRPERRKRWPKASEINDIYWTDVKNKNTLLSHAARIEEIFQAADLVIGYNLEFDLSMLETGGIKLGQPRIFDVMKEYAKTTPDGRWVKLTECAKRYGIEFAPHRSASDAMATILCYEALVSDEKYQEAIKRENVDEKTSDYSKGDSSNEKDYAFGCLAVVFILGIALLLLIIVAFLVSR